MKNQRAHYNRLTDLIARLVDDKRLQYSLTACLDDDCIGIAVYFTGAHICTIDVAIDNSNLLECVKTICSAHPTRNAPSYYVTTNTLGTRAVYSMAVITHSNYEDASRLKKRISADLAAVFNEADEETLVITNTYSDAYMSAGKYHITHLYQFDKD